MRHVRPEERHGVKKSPVAPTALLSWPRLGGTPGRKLGRGRNAPPYEGLVVWVTGGRGC